MRENLLLAPLIKIKIGGRWGAINSRTRWAEREKPQKGVRAGRRNRRNREKKPAGKKWKDVHHGGNAGAYLCLNLKKVRKRRETGEKE